jgi:hypothetical protein
MPEIKIVNCRKDKYDTYIGRIPNSNHHFGNPFSHKPNTYASVIVKTRDEAVDAYEDWLLGTRYKDVEQGRRKWILDNLCQLQGKRLGCFCSPKRCHGDILKKLVEKFYK